MFVIAVSCIKVRIPLFFAGNSLKMVVIINSREPKSNNSNSNRGINKTKGRNVCVFKTSWRKKKSLSCTMHCGHSLSYNAQDNYLIPCFRSLMQTVRDEISLCWFFIWHFGWPYNLGPGTPKLALAHHHCACYCFLGFILRYLKWISKDISRHLKCAKIEMNILIRDIAFHICEHCHVDFCDSFAQ